MSEESMERIVGRAVTNREYRERLLARPEEALKGAKFACAQASEQARPILPIVKQASGHLSHLNRYPVRGSAWSTWSDMPRRFGRMAIHRFDFYAFVYSLVNC